MSLSQVFTETGSHIVYMASLTPQRKPNKQLEAIHIEEPEPLRALPNFVASLDCLMIKIGNLCKVEELNTS